MKINYFVENQMTNVDDTLGFTDTETCELE